MAESELYYEHDYLYKYPCGLQINRFLIIPAYKLVFGSWRSAVERHPLRSLGSNSWQLVVVLHGITTIIAGNCTAVLLLEKSKLTFPML